VNSKLIEYERLLGTWPGLTSRSTRDPRPLVEDSLVLLPHLGGARTLVDVGSGGGMPGIPLKIARPELEVTLVEADRRKAAFLVHAAARLDLDLRVVPERAEAAAHGPLRETFDLVTCRALGPMPVLAELCLPFARVGGRLLAMKTTGEEVEAGFAAVFELLGGGPPEVVSAPTAAHGRGALVVVQKVAPTPPAYPRRPGLPAKRPLAPAGGRG
jgi:16S rRNA (guanine527-N7)-methyltransferase